MCMCAARIAYSIYLILLVQGQPVWMEHAAAIDVVGMEAAGVTLEDYVFYQVRVGLASWPA